MLILMSHRQIAAFHFPRVRLARLVALLLLFGFAFAHRASAQTKNAPLAPPECVETKRQLLEAQQLVRNQDFTIETLSDLLKIEKAKTATRGLSVDEFTELQQLRKEKTELQAELARRNADIQDRDKLIAALLDNKKSKGKSLLEQILEILLKRR